MIDKARHFDVVVLGGGAAGIVAAISATRSGKSAVICERMPALGKKILASGNGRCNLLNENLFESFYNPAARPLVKSVFSRFGKDDILKFFKELGLQTYSEDGRIFPTTNQSSSVLKILTDELKRLGVNIELGFDIASISDNGGEFVVTPKHGSKIRCGALIMACGGRSYPALGSDGSAYKFAEAFGHKVIIPVPSAVPLVTKDLVCQLLQGQKIFASIGEVSGELLFTKYGLSGTVILDISREISIEINRNCRKSVEIRVDMVPFMDEMELSAELEKRLASKVPAEELVTGILPNKFDRAFEMLLKTKDAAIIAKALKSKEFIVTGTRGWNEADFMAGGIDTSQVETGTLCSKFKKGLYFSGEMLDVDGQRGGYNLAWAWASGHVAGLTL